MNFPEKLKADLITEIYKQPETTQMKCIGLAKILNDIYGEDNKISKQIASVRHESLTKILEAKKVFLETLFGDVAPEPTEEQMKEFFSEEELKALASAEPAKPVTRKAWWKNLLLSVPVMEREFADVDHEALEHLTDINVVSSADSFNYTLEFFFDSTENPFFHNAKLTLEFIFEKDAGEDDEPIEIRGSPIQWKEGKNFTVVTKTKKGKGKSKVKKTVQEKIASFFNNFTTIKAEDIEEEEDEEEEDDEEVSDAKIFYGAIDLGNTIKTDLFTFMIPHFFGIEVESFKDAPDCDSDDGEHGHDHGAKGAKDAKAPECKNQ